MATYTTPSGAQVNTYSNGNVIGVITPESLKNTDPINIPPQPPVATGGISSNASIPSPFPTPESIVNDANAPTTADTQSTAVLNRIAALTGSGQTQTEIQNNAEKAAGLPQAAAGLNDLNTQLEGLNNQALALQNEAQYTIPNSVQNDAAGRGITNNVVGRLTTAQLRDNQIKQGAIATQALTLKSAIFGAQGKYNLAKDAADKAALAQYEHQQQQIDYEKAKLAALLPTLNKEEKARAAVIQAKLQDRQTQINNAIEDKKTIVAMATTALKNNPNDPAAQFAASEALKESNQQQPNLQKALALVGKYQQDPQAVAKAIAEINLTRAQTSKIYAEQAISNASNVDIPAVVSTIKNPNVTDPRLGGLTLNGLQQKAQTYMTNGGNIQGLGLSNSGASGIQRTLIANYAGYLADKLGLSIPQITAAYKANSKAATQVTERIAKIDTTSQTLIGQFPRLAQLAESVGSLGIKESDITAGKTAVARKFGSVDAGNYVELIQTVRGDYSALQSAIGGGRGGEFFGRNAQDAIPLGLTPEQYRGLAETIKQSADIASQASANEINKLIGGNVTGTSPSSETVQVVSPDGKTGTIPKANLDAALKAGYKQK